MADITPAISTMNDVEIAGDDPVTEALLLKIGANLNAMIRGAVPVGSMIPSDLSEASFQSEMGDTLGNLWVLCDGRSCVGTRYATLTGFTTLPDRRGVYIRGRNYTRSTTTGDTHGDQPVGTYEADQFASHTHSFRSPGGSGSSEAIGSQGLQGDTTGATGGSETNPRSSVANIFIRIN